MKYPPFLDNALEAPSKEIGTTLSNIFYAIFSPINFNVEKLKIKHLNKLKKYEDDIQAELSKIPEKMLIEPTLSFVGPALEASKFYIETDELRKMFAKIIASSMNSEEVSKVHAYFVEIIKQLSSSDALNLKLLLNYKELSLSEFLYATHMFDNSFGDFHCQAVSLDNLTRLGLISIIDIKPINDLILETIQSNQNLCSPSYFDPLEAEKVILSSLGTDFCSVCI